MMILIAAGIGTLALLLRLAMLARLTIPLLYTLSMLTVFHDWYLTNTVLADRILFALVGLVILSWLLTLGKRIRDLLHQASEDQAAAEFFVYRVRKARERGEGTVRTEDLRRRISQGPSAPGRSGHSS